MAKRRKTSRPRWSRPAPPRGVPAAFLRRFRRTDPKKAARVAEYVQRNAVDAYECVEVHLIAVANSVGLGDSTAWRYLRAGRWLMNNLHPDQFTRLIVT